ncbi:hypothetical protein OIU35_32255 [Boseaceae bacterium BT-24-1]|nr:hypothetical protein [Boseaceae bacterium BT-24-1]
MTRALAASFAMCMYAGYATAETSLVNLDDFIGGIEKADGEYACKTSEAVSALWKELRLRYVPYPNQKPLAKVNLPARFAAAFGKAKTENRDSAGYRRIIVPLTGTYRGLRTQRIAFDMGIENGISIVSILFDASKPEVEGVLGADLARATPMSWGSAEIVGRGKATELVCDLSS